MLKEKAGANYSTDFTAALGGLNRQGTQHAARPPCWPLGQRVVLGGRGAGRAAREPEVPPARTTHSCVHTLMCTHSLSFLPLFPSLSFPLLPLSLLYSSQALSLRVSFDVLSLSLPFSLFSLSLSPSLLLTSTLPPRVPLSTALLLHLQGLWVDLHSFCYTFSVQIHKSHCVTVAYNIQYSNLLCRFIA